MDNEIDSKRRRMNSRNVNGSRTLSNKFCKNSWRWFRIYIAFDVIIETHLRKECRVDTKGVLFLVKCFLTWIPLHSASNYLEILDTQYHIVEVYVTQYISRHAYYCLIWWTLSEHHIQAQNCWKGNI